MVLMFHAVIEVDYDYESSQSKLYAANMEAVSFFCTGRIGRRVRLKPWCVC